MKRLPYLTSLLAVFLLPNSFAYADELESIFDLSLKDLLNVKVSVASTKPESVIETPAIV
ncbi:MAG: hypothetical protein GY787_21195, partial [Alteromonadales bacterium]|nr:hypothetical protein [Alteromonadales bacterium]